MFCLCFFAQAQRIWHTQSIRATPTSRSTSLSNGLSEARRSIITDRKIDDSVFIVEMQNLSQAYFFLGPRRFDKKIDELESYQEKWLYLLRDVQFLENMPKVFKGESSFETYFSAAETANFSKEEREQYDRDMITKTDIKYALEYSHEKGLAEGRTEGREEGREEGRAEGEARKQREIAKALREAGTAVETISKATGLSVEQIAAL